jgi:ABC-type branched-subunit amino acid transport system ATPase component
MIKVKELRRSFGPVVAVDGISFEVEKGQVMGTVRSQWCGQDDGHANACLFYQARQWNCNCLRT